MTTAKTTTTRRKKTPAAPVEPMPATHELVSISDICKAESITEQAFRLALAELRPDDFDSIKAIPTTQSEQVLATLTTSKPTLPAQTSNTTETAQNAENQATQELLPAPETAPNQPQKPQNSDIVASGSNSPTVPTQGQNKPLPSALDELIASAEDDINLADLVLVYRNQQISQNAQSRDGEMVASLRERRIDRRNQVFDHLRDLNARQPVAPELPELPASLSDEIKALSGELGKSLVVG